MRHLSLSPVQQDRLVAAVEDASASGASAGEFAYYALHYVLDASDELLCDDLRSALVGVFGDVRDTGDVPSELQRVMSPHHAADDSEGGLRALLAAGGLRVSETTATVLGAAERSRLVAAIRAACESGRGDGMEDAVVAEIHRVVLEIVGPHVDGQVRSRFAGESGQWLVGHVTNVALFASEPAFALERTLKGLQVALGLEFEGPQGTRRVRHQRFGEGTVVAEREDGKIEVQFAAVGLRVLHERFVEHLD